MSLTRLIMAVAVLGVVTHSLFAMSLETCACEPADIDSPTACCAVHDEPPAAPQPCDDDCDCPKSCCTGFVKSPITVAPWRPALSWADDVELRSIERLNPHVNPTRSRLKRPPKA